MSSLHRFIVLETLILELGIIALSIALGIVKSDSSYGLPEVIGVISVLAGGFATATFLSVPDKGKP